MFKLANFYHWQKLQSVLKSHSENGIWQNKVEARILGVDIIYGSATFKDAQHVIVDNGISVLSTKEAKVVKAAGCHSKKIAIPDAEWGTTCEKKNSSNQQPGDTLIIDGGVTFASCIRGLGYNVTLLARTRVLRTNYEQMANIIKD